MEAEKIVIENLEKIEAVPLIKDFKMPENLTVFLKHFIDREIYDKYKEQKTVLGGTISHMINTGIKVDNKETVGIYATDGEAYSKFNQIFQKAIDYLHKYEKYFALYDLPDYSNNILSLPDSKKLHSIRFKYARNLKGFPYLPYIKAHTKKVIQDKILAAITNAEIKGTYHEIEHLHKESTEIHELENKFFDREENFFHSLSYTKEFSGIFLSEDGSVAFLINFNDHLQIVAVDENSNFSETYNKIKSIHSKLEKELHFDTDPVYGYLTSCPSNIGQGLKVSSFLDIPNAVTHGYFVLGLSRWSLRYKKHSSEHRTFYELMSKHKIGVSESAFINSYIVKIASMINIENKLLENPKFAVKQLESNKLKENVRLLYQNYFEKYKFIVTPNGVSFNGLFNLNSKKNAYNLLIADKESYLIFKDFIYDYLTATSNVHMNELSEKRDSLRQKYHNTLRSEELESFDAIEKNVQKTSIIVRRNVDEFNFTSIMNHSDLKSAYKVFLNVAKSLQSQFGGSVIDENNLESLYNLDFKFISEELAQMVRDKSKNHFNFSLEQCMCISKRDSGHFSSIQCYKSH